MAFNSQKKNIKDLNSSLHLEGNMTPVTLKKQRIHNLMEKLEGRTEK